MCALRTGPIPHMGKSNLATAVDTALPLAL